VRLAHHAEHAQVDPAEAPQLQRDGAAPAQCAGGRKGCCGNPAVGGIHRSPHSGRNAQPGRALAL
jgi:hypothetical protein